MDYLEQYKKYKDIKEIYEFIDDVLKLRSLYSTMQYDEMLKHIQYLMTKYEKETKEWKKNHNVPPQTYYQYYINAEAFLEAKGKDILIKKVINKI